MSKNSLMQITDFNITNPTAETASAMSMHQTIIEAEYSAASAMLTLCESLKAMRDTALYKHLGFESFEDYTEQACNIKRRQAYNYISTFERLGKDFMQSNAQLGITKLQLLSEVCTLDREDVVEQNDLEGMSVREIKDLVAKSREQGEQLSLLSQKIEDEHEDNEFNKGYIKELESEKEELERELAELKNKPVEVAVQEPSKEDIDKAVAAKTAELEKQYKADKKAAVKKAEEKAKAKAEQEHQKVIEEIKKNTAAEIEKKYQDQISTAEKAKAEAERKAKDFASKLDKNADADLVKASVYFMEVQTALNNFLQSTAQIAKTNEEKSNKLKMSASALLKDIIAELES